MGLICWDQGRVGGTLLKAQRSEEHVVVLYWQSSLSLAHVHLHEIIVALPEPRRCWARGWVWGVGYKGACGVMMVCVRWRVGWRMCECACVLVYCGCVLCRRASVSRGGIRDKCACM